MRKLKRLLPITLLSLVACSDEIGDLGTGPAAGSIAHAELSCQVDLSSQTLGCAPSEGSVAAGASGAILAGQGVNIILESSNVSFDAGIFSATVVVRNFLDQELGTGAEGVQVFFLEEPAVTLGSGTVTVNNPTGFGNFTGNDQPYFGYPGPLGPGKASAGQVWEWAVSPDVDAFSFKVAVQGAVADEGNLTPAQQITAKAIASMRYHTCALDEAGQAYCWGEGTYGQLGHGALGNSDRPVAVAGGFAFDQIAIGHYHSCALTEDGTAYCWGRNNWGQLGDGTTNSSSVPVAVNTGLKFVDINLGESHTCGITTNNDAYCWGRGNWAKLGNNQRGEAYYEALPIPVGTSLKFSSITAGQNHTCAVEINTGSGYCWGHDGNGRSALGVGGRVDTVSEMLGGMTYQSIAAGTSYSCGLTTGGEIYCFGVNNSEMQGHGLVEGTSPVAQDEPVHPVAGGHTWIDMDASHAHTCGITDSGDAYCWGNSGSGRLGIGETDGNVPTPVKLATSEKFTQIAVGWYTTCGITTEKKVFCSGAATNGRNGLGTAEDRWVPVPLSTVAN